jgi:hypothetical protein
MANSLRPTDCHLRRLANPCPAFALAESGAKANTRSLVHDQAIGIVQDSTEYL